jgi:serine/threonine protein kinase
MYNPIKFLGEGGYGIVYLAERWIGDVLDYVILKTIKKEFIDTFAKKLNLKREINIPRLCLGRHDNIINITGYIETEKYYIIVSEYTGDSIDLYDYLLPENMTQKLNLLYQLVDTLEFIHRHNIVHRDIKPENIIIDHQGNPIFIDFSFASIIGSNNYPCVGIAGSPEYLAPELLNRPEKTPNVDYFKVDIYGLGLLFYFVLNRSMHPFSEQGVRESDSGNRVMDKLIMRTVSREPDNRPTLKDIRVITLDELNKSRNADKNKDEVS